MYAQLLFDSSANLKVRENPKSDKNCYFVNTALSQKFNEIKDRAESDESYLCLSRFLRRTDFSEFNVIIIPINHNSNHWILIVVVLDISCIVCYDSLSTEITESKKFYMKLVVIWLAIRKIKGKFRWFMFYQDNIPQQTNGHDCGVFLLMYSYCIVNNLEKNFINTQTMAYWRKKIAKDIISRNIV
jgi:Ulp1 family protease